MQSSSSMPSDRARVVARVEQALALAVIRLEEREKALSQHATAPQLSIRPDFARFEQRLNLLANCPQPAGQQLTDIDVSLRDGEEALRNWLARAETTRRKLASGEGRAVG